MEKVKRKISVLLGAVLASFALVSVPTSPASAAELNCRISISEDWQRKSALCSSGPGTRYRAWVQCTNDVLLMGPARYYGTGVASVVECSAGFRIKNHGVQTLM